MSSSMWLTGVMKETIFQHSSNNFFVDHVGDEESRRDKRTVCGIIQAELESHVV